MSPKKTLWVLWIAGTVVLVTHLGARMLEGPDKSVFMPGPLTAGHHQIALRCDACHGAPFAGKDGFQDQCLECHGHERNIKTLDSHPKSKFTDPRNVDLVARVDALRCVTCHVEHRPEITRANGVTQPADFCVHCHEGIAEDRTSHKGMAFESCYSAGCHNFHDNRALYEDFLVKHADEPERLEKARVPGRDFGELLDQIPGYPLETFPPRRLTASDADAPAGLFRDRKPVAEWLASAHAEAGVRCSACHRVVDPGSGQGGSKQTRWVERPDHGPCRACHGPEVDGFLHGKHGMRLVLDLPPMRPGLARLPMKSKARDKALSCMSCHPAHRYDARLAAVRACLGCHDDTHSRAYRGSPHELLWRKEAAGELPPGSGVSCATCHLPRVSFDAGEFLSRTLVEHDQNDTLRPNEKMVRPACLHCHGLGYALDALADRALIDRNFRGKPRVHVKSLEMAQAEAERHLRETRSEPPPE